MYEPNVAYECRSANALKHIADNLREIKKAVVPESTKEVFFDDNKPEDEEKDLVEVVRCEKCESCAHAYKEDGTLISYCLLHERHTNGRDFCSQGKVFERRIDIL